MAQIIVLQHDTATRANIITVRTNARKFVPMPEKLTVSVKLSSSSNSKRSCAADRL